MRFLLATLLFSFFANATKIAVVNYSYLEVNAKVTQSISKQIQERQEMLQEEVKKIQADVQNKVKNLEKSASVLTAKALDQKKIALQSELMKTDESLKARAKKLEEIKNKTLLDLNDKIKEIVARIAKDKECDIVLPESSAVYYNAEFDITADVLSELNKKVKTIKIDWGK